MSLSSITSTRCWVCAMKLNSSSASDSWVLGGVSEEPCSDSGENSSITASLSRLGGRGSILLLEDLVLDTEDFLSSGDRDMEGGLARGNACLVAHSST